MDKLNEYYKNKGCGLYVLFAFFLSIPLLAQEDTGNNGNNQSADNFGGDTEYQYGIVKNAVKPIPVSKTPPIAKSAVPTTWFRTRMFWIRGLVRRFGLSVRWAGRTIRRN